MKKIKILLVFIALITIKLSAQDQTLFTGHFDGIRCRGMAIFKLIPSDSSYVTLNTTDSEIIDFISVEEQGSVLNIDITKKNANLSKLFDRVIIKIYFTDIEQIILEGACSMESVGPVITDRLITSLAGTCKADLEVECKDFEGKIYGSSMLDIKGKGTHAIVGIEGIGSFHGKDFETETMDVKLEGIGSATVNSTYELKARVSGVGNVDYIGEPKEKDFNVDGVGSVKKYNESKNY